jgi:hypothetical protein
MPSNRSPARCSTARSTPKSKRNNSAASVSPGRTFSNHDAPTLGTIRPGNLARGPGLLAAGRHHQRPEQIRETVRAMFMAERFQDSNAFLQ